MKTNKYVAWAVILLPSLVLLASAIFKFMPNEEMKAGMAGSGFLPILSYLGALELVITVLYIVPSTRRIGFYLVCSYLGGAIAIHINKSDGPLVPAIVLALVWVGAYLTLPNFLGGVDKREG